MHSHFMAEVQRHGFDTVLERADRRGALGQRRPPLHLGRRRRRRPGPCARYGLTRAGRPHQRPGPAGRPADVRRGRHGGHGRRGGEPALRLGQQHHGPLRAPLRPRGAHRDRHATSRHDLARLPRRAGRAGPGGSRGGAMGRVGTARRADDATRLGWQEDGAAGLGHSQVGQLYTAAPSSRSSDASLFARCWALVASVEELASRALHDGDGRRGSRSSWCAARTGIAGLPQRVPPSRHALARGGRRARALHHLPVPPVELRLDGDLVRVPQAGASNFADLDRCGLGLRPAAVSEWDGMVFGESSPAMRRSFAQRVGRPRRPSGPVPLRRRPVALVSNGGVQARLQLEAPGGEPHRRVPLVVPASAVVGAYAIARSSGSPSGQLVEPRADEGAGAEGSPAKKATGQQGCRG